MLVFVVIVEQIARTTGAASSHSNARAARRARLCSRIISRNIFTVFHISHAGRQRMGEIQGRTGCPRQEQTCGCVFLRQERRYRRRRRQ